MTQETGASLVKKLVGAGLTVLAAYGLFLLIVRGVFASMMGARPENGVYVLFYGGAVVLIVMVGIGMGAAALLAGRKIAMAAQPSLPAIQSKPASPPSSLSRGIALGLVTVVAVVGLYFALFMWAWAKVR